MLCNGDTETDNYYSTKHRPADVMAQPIKAPAWKKTTTIKLINIQYKNVFIKENRKKLKKKLICQFLSAF